MKRATSHQQADLRTSVSPSPVASGVGRGADATLLLDAVPVELQGAWGPSPPHAVMRVLSRMRDACLSEVNLFSDRQPNRLRVEHRSGDYPSIWLDDDDPSLAWIIVSISPCAWCQLAYQFGHELGHVLCNSWSYCSIPKAPCQWFEEFLAEAFTIRGLALLAASWERDPPFEGNASFGASIVKYRYDLIERYKTDIQSLGSWFHGRRDALDRQGGESSAEGPATLAILRELETDMACVEDLGALNRWPERSGVPIETYLSLWEFSCAEIGASGVLPKRLRRLFDLC